MADPTPELTGAARSRGPWRRWGGVAAAALALGFLGWALADQWTAVTEYSWDLEPGLLVLGCLVLLLFYAVSGLAWADIVDRVHHPGPPAAASVSIWARSLLGRYVPGSVVMVVGRVVWNHERGVPRRSTLAAMAYEQLLTVGVAAGGGVLYLAFGSRGGDGTAWLVALIPLGLIGLHPRIFGPATTWLLRRAGREPLPRLIPTGPLIGLLGLYVVAATLLGLGIWLLVRSAAGPEVGGPAFVGTAFLLSFAISMVAVIFPSGLGIREGAFAVALSQNVPGGVAVALAVGTRLALTLVELAFVALAVLVGRRR